jgi:hypothetical protein
MEKLYKRIDGKLQYHEAWAAKKKLIEHWGVVGDRGEHKEHKLPRGTSEEDALTAILQPALAAGYAPFDEDEFRILLIEYAVNGMGSRADVNKRHRLQDRMDETLGWTALGHCDGGSIGSGTMEVCCFVVDFEIAKSVIAVDLKDTEFRDFTRIYDEDADE